MFKLPQIFHVFQLQRVKAEKMRIRFTELLRVEGFSSHKYVFMGLGESALKKGGTFPCPSAVLPIASQSIRIHCWGGTYNNNKNDKHQTHHGS